MAEPNVLSLSKLMSDLVNRKVTFAPSRNIAPPIVPQMFGTYTVLPNAAALLVRADIRLLASLGAGLTGLPDTAIAEHMKPLSESLRDAIHETLNIMSTAVTPHGRAVFQGIASNLDEIGDPAKAMMKVPYHKSFFDVSIQDYQGGRMAVFASLSAQS